MARAPRCDRATSSSRVFGSMWTPTGYFPGLHHKSIWAKTWLANEQLITKAERGSRMFMKASVSDHSRSASYFKRLRYHYSDQTYMWSSFAQTIRVNKTHQKICGFGINFRQFTSPIHDEAQYWINISAFVLFFIGTFMCLCVLCQSVIMGLRELTCSDNVTASYERTHKQRKLAFTMEHAQLVNDIKTG